MQTADHHILLIEDDTVDRTTLERALGAALPECTVTAVGGLDDARRVLDVEPVDCILTDYFLTDGSAFELLAAHFVRLPPIVIVTAAGALSDAVQALKLGAADYLEKSDMRPEVLKEAVERAVRQRRVEVERERRFAENAWRSMYDELSGLPNRHLLHDRLDMELKGARREGAGLGVLLIDLNGFKALNDEYGHAAGDQAVRIVAARLSGFARDSDTFARYGGDEFCGLLPGLGHPHDLELIARRAARRIAEVFTFGGNPVSVSAAIGGAVFPVHGQDAPTLLAAADDAMYRAKRAGIEFAAAPRADEPSTAA